MTWVIIIAALIVFFIAVVIANIKIVPQSKAYVVERLGAPSHFLAVSDTEYHLDYFISRDDKRSGIMVNIDPLNDTVNSIEISYY